MCLLTRDPGRSVEEFIDGVDGGERALSCDFPRDLQSDQGIDDCPCMDDGLHGIPRCSDAEVFTPFQEEWPLFRKEESVPQIDIHLSRIRLDLAKIGVDGPVQDQVRRNAVLGCEAQIPLLFVLHQRTCFLPVSLVVGDGGQEFEQRVVFQVAIDQGLHLRQELVSLLRVHRGEGSLLGAPADAPFEEHGHLNRVLVGIPDAFEWHLDLDRISLVVDLPGTVPNQVETVILDSRREAAIRLDAEGIDIEGI